MNRRPHSEGEEFSLHNLEQWCVISPLRGDVLFVDLRSTDYGLDEEVWAPFLVMEVALLKALGTLSIEAKFLGGCTQEVNKELSARFNRRTGRIHLCGTTPCLEEEAGSLHVTRFLWYTLQGAEGWLTSRAIRTANSWLQGTKQAEETVDLDAPAEEHTKVDDGHKDQEEADKEEARPGILRRTRRETKGTSSAPSLPSKPDESKDKVVQPFKKSAAKPRGSTTPAAPSSSKLTGKGIGGGPGAKAALDPAKVQKLRDELKNSRQKLAAGGPPDPSPGDEGDGSEGDSESTGSEDSPSAVGPRTLTAGTLMKVAGSHTSAKAIKDGTTGDYHEQLIQRAAGTAELSRREGGVQEKKKRSRSPSKRKSSKKDKDRSKDRSSKKKKKDRKDDKKKKKRRGKKKKKKDRKTKTLSDGRTVSCTSGSKSSSEESQSTDEDAELEAPLRRRSYKHPGSVLNLLLEHIANQLQQSAEVDTPASAKGDLTSGVKVVSYLALAIRPQFGHRPKELRELHNLATCIDLLRQGQLARLGDVLAGRLIAIHQSLLDASWVSARHLEVMPMPEGTALSDGVLLAARKHGRQVSRAQDPSQGWRSPKGKGRGKKGQEWSHYESEQDGSWWQPKGKGKQSKKGKSKKDKDKEGGDKPAEK